MAGRSTPRFVRLMRDVVRYRLPLGWLGSVAAGWKVEAQVEKIFAYRAQRIAERFGSVERVAAREVEAEAA